MAECFPIEHLSYEFIHKEEFESYRLATTEFVLGTIVHGYIDQCIERGNSLDTLIDKMSSILSLDSQRANPLTESSILDLKIEELNKVGESLIRSIYKDEHLLYQSLARQLPCNFVVIQQMNPRTEVKFTINESYLTLYMLEVDNYFVLLYPKRKRNSGNFTSRLANKIQCHSCLKLVSIDQITQSEKCLNCKLCHNTKRSGDKCSTCGHLFFRKETMDTTGRKNIKIDTCGQIESLFKSHIHEIKKAKDNVIKLRDKCLSRVSLVFNEQEKRLQEYLNTVKQARRSLKAKRSLNLAIQKTLISETQKAHQELEPFVKVKTSRYAIETPKLSIDLPLYDYFNYPELPDLAIENACFICAEKNSVVENSCGCRMCQKCIFKANKSSHCIVCRNPNSPEAIKFIVDLLSQKRHEENYVRSPNSINLYSRSLPHLST